MKQTPLLPDKNQLTLFDIEEQCQKSIDKWKTEGVQLVFPELVEEFKEEQDQDAIRKMLHEHTIFPIMEAVDSRDIPQINIKILSVKSQENVDALESNPNFMRWEVEKYLGQTPFELLGLNTQKPVIIKGENPEREYTMSHLKSAAKKIRR